METEEKIWRAEEEKADSVRYLPFLERLTSEELGEYTSYGIRAIRDGEVIAAVSDVTADRVAAERLARLCTENGLSAEQLFDVIEDFLGNF